MERALLRVEGVRKQFGGLRALDDVSFTVAEGSIVGLIGPNGAGKTTLFNVISGVLKPEAGRVVFRDEDITGLSPDQVARRGIGRLFQMSRLFNRMTVWENLRVVAHDSLLETRGRELLDLVGLTPLAGEYAGDLSFGQQRLLELVRVMMLEPRLVLLDEPTAGINPTMRRHILDLLHTLNRKGVTFLVIEHEMKVIMEHCHWVIALNFGRKIAEGPPEAVRNNEQVLEAYFGTGAR